MTKKLRKLNSVVYSQRIVVEQSFLSNTLIALSHWVKKKLPKKNRNFHFSTKK